MTFTEQISTYAGSTSGYSTSISQFLSDGVKEVVNTIVSSNPDEAPNFTGETVLNSTTPALSLPDTDYVIDVQRYSEVSGETGYRRCDRVKPHLIPELDNTDSIYYTTTSSPVYYILNQELQILPTPTDTSVAKVTHIQYGEIDDTAGTIGKLEIFLEDVTSGTPATGAEFIWTSVGHGLVDGDKVVIENADVLTELEGSIQVVNQIDSDTFKLNGIRYDGSNVETGMDCRRVGIGFPTKFNPQVVRYASLRLLGQKAVEVRDSLPTLALPVLPVEPDAPSFTYNDVSVVDIVQPILDIGDMADLEVAVPVYTPPVVTPDFEAVQDFITDEDPELVTAQLGKITSQLQEYNMEIQSALNEFNEENVKFQEDVQRKTQNFQKDMQEAITNAQNDITVNSGNMNKELQIDLQNKTQAFQKEVQEYGSEIQRYSGLVNAYQGEVQAVVQEFTSNLQKETTDYQWIVGQIQIVKGEYDTFWGIYSKIGEQ